MPRYAYTAIASTGESIDGEIEAANDQAAIERLQKSGHFPISTQQIESKQRRTKTSPLSFRNKITSGDVMHFTQELSTLLNAGVPLDTSLQHIENLSHKEAVKSMVRSVHNEVQGGSLLSAALENYEPAFDRLYLNMIRAGESGGALEMALDRLSNYLERAAELRSTIVSAMIYPLVLVVVAGVSVFILMTYIVPSFIPLFEDAGQSLPFLTQVIFNISEFLSNQWWLVLGLLAVLILSVNAYLKTDNGRLAWDRLSLELPIFGAVTTKINVARFARTLSTLLYNGVPLLTSIAIVKDVVKNRLLSAVLDAAAKTLEDGGHLSTPLRESKYFPEMAVQLIQIGEKSGDLEGMLTKIGVIYEREAQTAIKRMLAIMEPIIIIGLGGLIAIIIISILLAILGLNELAV